MKWLPLFLPVGVLVLAGCNEYGYPLKPQGQSALSPNPIFAEVKENGNVEVLIDTHGRRLESVQITTADGRVVEPTRVKYPAFEAESDDAYDWQYTTEEAQGPTVAYFNKDAIGAGPWKINVDVQGVRPKTIRVESESQIAHED